MRNTHVPAAAANTSAATARKAASQNTSAGRVSTQARFAPAAVAKAAQYTQVEALLAERNFERATGVARMTSAKMIKKRRWLRPGRRVAGRKRPSVENPKPWNWMSCGLRSRDAAGTSAATTPTNGRPTPRSCLLAITGPIPKATARPTLWKPPIAPCANDAAYWSVNPARLAKVYARTRLGLKL